MVISQVNVDGFKPFFYFELVHFLIFCINVAVYDGHGGGGVSSYLREQLYSAYQKYLGVILRQGCKAPTLGNRVAALRAAFDEVDTKVMLDDDLMDQGSTAVCCILHKEPDTGKKVTKSFSVFQFITCR